MESGNSLGQKRVIVAICEIAVVLIIFCTIFYSHTS